MKIDKHQYPVIIITALVIFTVLGIVLGFKPSHRGENGRNLIIPMADFATQIIKYPTSIYGV